MDSEIYSHDFKNVIQNNHILLYKTVLKILPRLIISVAYSAGIAPFSDT